MGFICKAHKESFVWNKPNTSFHINLIRVKLISNKAQSHYILFTLERQSANCDNVWEEIYGQMKIWGVYGKSERVDVELSLSIMSYIKSEPSDMC